MVINKCAPKKEEKEYTERSHHRWNIKVMLKINKMNLVANWCKNKLINVKTNKQKYATSKTMENTMLKDRTFPSLKICGNVK